MDDKSKKDTPITISITGVSADDSVLLKKTTPPGPKLTRPAAPTGRPKLNTIHSSDASRFMTLERLQQNMSLKSHSNKKEQDPLYQHHSQQQQTPPQPPQQQNQERQLTIETAVFPEQQPIFSHNNNNYHHNNHSNNNNNNHNNNNNEKIKGHHQHNGTSGSQSDTKSIRSGSESTRGTNNKRHKRRPHKSTIKPTEIFAQNLSDAVLDANDSDEQEAFVYRDRNSLYPTLPASFQWSANHPDGKRHNTDGDSYYTKPRRPVLRSAVSELPPTAMLRTPAASSFRSSPPPPLPNKYNNNYNKDKNNTKRHHYHHQNYYSTKHKDHDWYPSDADEDAPLLPRYSPNSKRKRRQVYSNSKSNNNNYKNKRKTIALWSLFSACVAMTSMWFMLVFTTALPLSPVEVLELSNVLGSSKELFFDLNVRARNTNFWSIEISHASFSVFASSHLVPTVAEMAINNTSSGMMASPVEFLSTIYQLDEPLVFQPARFFKPSTTVASSQIQIRNPGKTKGDSGGNERWSLLIHYPYELTIRGVLKYRMIPMIPWAQMHSARICQVSRVDPATGEISSIPESEKSICDDPSSPIETTVISSTTTTTIASSS